MHNILVEFFNLTSELTITVLFNLFFGVRIWAVEGEQSPEQPLPSANDALRKMFRLAPE